MTHQMIFTSETEICQLGSKANDKQLVRPFLDIQFEFIHFSYLFELSHSEPWC